MLLQTPSIPIFSNIFRLKSYGIYTQRRTTTENSVSNTLLLGFKVLYVFCHEVDSYWDEILLLENINFFDGAVNFRLYP